MTRLAPSTLPSTKRATAPFAKQANFMVGSRSGGFIFSAPRLATASVRHARFVGSNEGRYKPLMMGTIRQLTRQFHRALLFVGPGEPTPLSGQKGLRMHVLLAQDDKSLLNALTQGLERNGIEVDLAGDSDEAIYKIKNNPTYDAVIVDFTYAPIDTVSLIEKWRTAGIQATILVLSANDTAVYKTLVLNSGADAYLSKPFQLEELLARLRALTRRNNPTQGRVVRVDDLEIDPSSRTVKRAGNLIHLTHREFDVLAFLASHIGKVVTRTMIREHLYKDYDPDTSNVVDVYVRYLRKKIDQGYDKPLILTQWGQGYMLHLDDEKT
jgi:DNA-binding response OmpR family regulator